MNNSKEKNINGILLKTIFIIASIMFAIPSIMYMMKNKTIFGFDHYFQFLLNDTSRVDQTLIYLLVLTILTIIYFIFIKYREKLFKNIKSILIFIAIISVIFIAVIPFTCSDVFYYLGIGRIDSEYGQNPYYTTIKDFVETGDNNNYLKTDTVLKQGYQNDWADSTVVYGPVWTLICKAVAAMSFGSIDIGLLMFKIVNVLVHLLNAYLIYKISRKKIFAVMYGLNPFILIEGISSVHNDMFVIMFVLLSLFCLIRKKKLALSIIFIALATTIKYFTILFLPIIILYYFRKEKPGKRFLKCIQYGLLFLIVIIIPYLVYVRDFNVISGLFIQQEKLAKSIYIVITQYFKDPPGIANIVKTTLLYSFAIIYMTKCLVLLFKKEINIKQEFSTLNIFLMAFTFLLITNFQPWYIMWLFPLIIWQKASMIKLIIQISIIAEFANAVFLLNTESWPNGTPFIFIMFVSILGMYILDEKSAKDRQIKCYKKQQDFKKLNDC